MRKIALVAQREYAEHVRTKGFWIGVLAFPLILALSVAVPILLSGTKQARTYAVIDHSGFVLQEVEKGILAEDLGIVLRDAAERYRDGGRAWERLPDAVRAAAKVYVGLDEAERPALVQDLTLSGDEVAAGLVEWWQQVSAEELEAPRLGTLAQPLRPGGGAQRRRSARRAQSHGERWLALCVLRHLPRSSRQRRGVQIYLFEPDRSGLAPLVCRPGVPSGAGAAH